MTFWAKTLRLFSASMPTPKPFGIFHVFFLIFSISIGLLLCRYCKNPSEKFIRIFLLLVSVMVIILEIYKQIHFGIINAGGKGFKMHWYFFPFQFCSTPMYIGLLAAVVKKYKTHYRLCTYLATYALFAGICVMAYPGDVYTNTFGVNVQTSICHGSMITVGIFLLGSGYVKSEHRTILKAVPVFVSLVGIAMVLNEAAHLSGLTKTVEFNMFFISPYCEPYLPVYSAVQRAVPFPLCVFIYVCGFTLAGYFMVLISMLLKGRKNKRI